MKDYFFNPTMKKLVLKFKSECATFCLFHLQLEAKLVRYKKFQSEIFVHHVFEFDTPDLFILPKPFLCVLPLQRERPALCLCFTLTHFTDVTTSLCLTLLFSPLESVSISH